MNFRFPTIMMSVIISIQSIGWTQTGLEIAQKVEARPAPKDMQSQLKMVLTNQKGKTRTSELISHSKADNAMQMIWFINPPDDRGVAFLKIEHSDRDDEMRLWLPAFKKIRRISASKQSDAFMGSDLSYEDMTNRDLTEYSYHLLREEKLDGIDCYVLELIPVPDLHTEYSRHLEWIHKVNFTVLKSESYDRKDRLLKKRFIQYKIVSGYHLPVEIKVMNVQKQHRTQLAFDAIMVDTGISDDLFQEKNLKRMPTLIPHN